MSTTTITKTKKSNSKKALDFSKDQYLKWYRDMLLMRKVEERIGHLYIQQKFGGFCHLYIGQEAVVAGTASACIKEDKHITAYRDHAHPIALGVIPNIWLQNYMVKRLECQKVKGGQCTCSVKKLT